MNSTVLWLRMTAVSGGLAIVLGAFGAHGLEGKVEADLLAVFETGVRYHFYHTLAMLALCCLAQERTLPKPLPAIFMTWLVGIAVFSGSLYLLTVTGIRWLGAITPIGGTAMIVGWVWLACAASRVFRAER